MLETEVSVTPHAFFFFLNNALQGIIQGHLGELRVGKAQCTYIGMAQ